MINNFQPKNEKQVILVAKKKVTLDVASYQHIIDKDVKLEVIGGFATVNVDGRNYKLCNYIYYNFYGNIPDPNNPCLSHVNGDKLDDRLENLVPTTFAKLAPEKFTNQYQNITPGREGKWRCVVTIDKMSHKYTYSDIMHALYHRDLIIRENNAEHILDLYYVAKPVDFVLKVHHVKTDGLPVGIRHAKTKGYFFEVPNEHYGKPKEAKNKRVYGKDLNNTVELRKKYIEQKNKKSQ